MSQQKQGKVLQLVHGLGYGLVAGLIFISGWGVGSGRIVLSQDQLFRKSIQKNLPQDLDYSSVEELYDSLRQNFDGQLTVDQLLNGLKAGLANASGDPYTEFLDTKSAADFDNALDGTFIGIGAELGKDSDGNIIVIAPISGFPAEKAGLKAQDVIAEVDGETTSGKTVNDVVARIRGEENTTVKLRIIRNRAEDLNIEITRQKITIPSVTSEIKTGSIGYIRISRFASDTVELATKAAKQLRASGVRGMVLDLRNNPGGLVDSAVGVSELWLDSGKTILQEKRGGEVIKTYYARDDAVLKGLPTIVLINEGSASASEITAGALRDNNAATLIGTKSFGKGSVQQLDQFGDGSILKVTIARWFTPKGVNIDKEGIKPDKEVKRTSEDFERGRDPQLDVALRALLKL